MKHKLDGPVDVNVSVEFDKEDVEDVIDKITESAIILITVATSAALIKKWLT